jgi:hypothetical protein
MILDKNSRDRDASGVESIARGSSVGSDDENWFAEVVEESRNVSQGRGQVSDESEACIVA